MKVGIVGCGLIGSRRADFLGEDEIVIVADVSEQRAKELADKYNCKFATDYRKVTQNPEVEAVIIATTNQFLAEIATDAIHNNKHCLIEKPGARTLVEYEQLMNLAKEKEVQVKIGYNHRFHPSFQKAREIVDSREIGEVMFVRGRYGHGGRLGYDKEWRADPQKSGGGEMLDQGTHLIDLARWFCGEFTEVNGHVGTFFWNMPVEDNGFALLKTENGKVAWLTASCTQWKNLFSFEIHCKTGLLVIDGLGGSYGKETLTFYKMKPEMGIPDQEQWSWEEDDSWKKEWQEFSTAIAHGSEVMSSIEESYGNFKVVSELYKANDTKIHNP
ncbi:MAG: Gfo/Idh/MocA family oxidoreductase [Candidatus Undinarchaeales archaeon]|jgi:predicted dehydrogenase|nr:Gfo/Idh/MocA family oxidoreductase [Candidatus Undinarchaeales archaeon]